MLKPSAAEIHQISPSACWLRASHSRPSNRGLCRRAPSPAGPQTEVSAGGRGAQTERRRNTPDFIVSLLAACLPQQALKPRSPPEGAFNSRPSNRGLSRRQQCSNRAPPKQNQFLNPVANRLETPDSGGETLSKANRQESEANRLEANRLCSGPPGCPPNRPGPAQTELLAQTAPGPLEGGS